MCRQLIFKTAMLCCLLLIFYQDLFGLSTFRRMDSIQVVLDSSSLILPGESFPIGIVAYSSKGKVKKTSGLAGGSSWWWNYKVDVTGGFFESGRVRVSDKLVPSKGKYIEIKAYPKKQPELAKQLLLPLNYETRVEFRPTDGFDKAPGSQIKGELYTEFDNGASRICRNLRSGREAELFEYSAMGGVWKNGKFTIDPDFTRIEGHRSALVVNSVRNIAVSDTFEVRLDYRHMYKLDFSGSSGAMGFSGSNGSQGSSGYNGYDGQPGLHGGFGEDGPDIGVWIDLYRDSILNCDLLYVYAQNFWTGEEFRYLINPDGGKLKVSSDGGSGGMGGSGGSGGSGGDGRDGEKWVETHVEKRIVKKPVVKKSIRKEKQKKTDAEGKEYEVEVDVEVSETVMTDVEEDVVVNVEKQGPGEDGGDGGWGGPGGLGAPGGYGGNIYLYFTNDAMPYRNRIEARSSGGSGGKHGWGGSGGSGGRGGSGNPNGRSGSSGQSGPSAPGWAEQGESGDIFIGTTEEFVHYEKAK